MAGSGLTSRLDLSGPGGVLAFAFDDAASVPDAGRLALLGGKGKSLADMAAVLGLPVPPGFTLTTEACAIYLNEGWRRSFDDAIDRHLARMAARLGRSFGDTASPLLVSVRSGAAASMPGMMDTVLNVGLGAATRDGFAAFAADRAFVEDCAQRLNHTFRKAVGAPPPADARAQLRQAIEAVFRSWNSTRAQAYRRIEDIPDGAGTAVTVQAMVFGNRDENSGTGVVFSRDPSTGAPALFGDVLFRAQGEDVVSGTRETLPVTDLDGRLPAIGRDLRRCVDSIERHYRDLVEVEFTIETGRLWILQARRGKRSAAAAIRIAHDMALDPGFPLTKAEAVARVSGELKSAQVRTRVESGLAPLGRGLGASPGIAVGRLVTSAERAVTAAGEGRDVILARPETSPEDVEGIAASAGLLTARGGLASHAAVVARGWGKPAVVGWAAMSLTIDGIEVDGRAIVCGTEISIDGESGEVFLGAVEVEDSDVSEAAEMLAWGASPPVATPAGPPSADAAADDDVILLLALKGLWSRDAACQILGVDADGLARRLAGLQADVDAGNARFLKPTAAGQARAAAFTSGHRAALGDARAIHALDSFGALNGAFKDLATRWQVRTVDGKPQPNDHGDAAYDAPVLNDMDGLHARTMMWLGATAPAGPLAFFSRRFEAAIGRLRGGETAFLASPRVDSYHNVWFELHEYLIRLAGRTRAQEKDS